MSRRERWSLLVEVVLTGSAAHDWAATYDRRSLVGVFTEDDTAAPDIVAGLLVFTEAAATADAPVVGDRTLTTSAAFGARLRASGWSGETSCHDAHTHALRMLHELVPQVYHDQITATSTDVTLNPED